MKTKLAMLLVCFLVFGSALAQELITGTVVDIHGEPLEGAHVRVAGTQIAVATDAQGHFTLQNIPEGKKNIQVSYIGYQSEVSTIANGQTITLKENDTALNEAMVVAYGTQKKSAFTGSAGVIKSEKIEARVNSNVSNALSGQVAGVQTFSNDGAPGSGSSIRIRGIGSRSASASPLYVVDGSPYDGNINAINPTDIESITVLKDAAANAIYGARGANGVILITTKSGKTEDAKITVDAKWGSSSRAIPNYSHIGPQAYVETAYQALYNSKAYAGASAVDARSFALSNLWNAANGGLGYQIYQVPNGQAIIGHNGKLNPLATLGYSDGEHYYTPDDWYEELFGKGNLRQEYNINVSGRVNNLSYYASVGYLNDNGIVNNSGFQRYTGRGKVDYQAKKWLKIGTNMSLTQTQTTGNGDNIWGSTGNLFYIANMIAPIYPMYVRDAQGNIMYEPATGTPLYDNGSTATNFRRPFCNGARPGAIIDNDRNINYNTTFSGRWYATLTPISGLNITASISDNEINSRSNNLGSIYAASISTDGNVSVSHSRTSAVNTQYMASYHRLFADEHDLDVLVGYESYRLKMQALSGSNDHLFDPFIGELGNAGGTSQKKATSSTDNYFTQGIIGRAQYNYDEKYFASASFRRDASSRFAKGHRWGNFGSMGAAWRISKEDFMISTRGWLDELKLKVSWGVQGNDALLDQYGYANYYPYMDQYNVTYSESTKEYSKTLTSAGNKDLTWEHNSEWNAGLEFSLWNGRLSGGIEYFNRKTTDMLYHKSVPLSSGITTGFVDTNIGSMRNAGVELDLTAYFIKTQDINWSFNMNLTHYVNKVLSLDPTVEKLGIRGPSTIVRVGGSLYNSYLVRYAGVDPINGQSLYYVDPDNGDWSTTPNYEGAEQSDLGSTLPAIYGGFGTNFNWKGLDFGIQLAYQVGGRLYDTTYQEMMHTGMSSLIGCNWHKDILNAWTPDNRTTDVPRVNAADNSDQLICDRFLTSSNYLALNNITLGYTLPENLTKQWQISSIRVYVTGDNLGIISARRGFDPRTGIGAGSFTGSSNASNYSARRNIVGGVTFTF